MSPTTLELEPPVRDRRIPPPLPPPFGDDGEGGEPEPSGPSLDNAELGVLFLIGAEVMFFAGLISSFWILRLSAPLWPPAGQPRLPLAVTAVNTLGLLASSVVMLRAVRAQAREDTAGLVRRLALAGGLGLLFVVGQGYEWGRLIAFGLTIASGSYGATFYTLIGAHAVHVIAALAWLTVVTVWARRRRFVGRPAGALRACALYWYFVVGLWPVLYVSVYLAR